MPFCYTPALSAWFLAAAVLGTLAFTRCRRLRPALAWALAYGAISLAASITVLVRARLLLDNLKVGGFPNLSAGDWAYRLSSGFHAAVGLEESLVPAPLMLGMLAVLAHAVARRSWPVILLCLWAAATVAASLVLRGYCWRPPEFDVHRAMVILPPLSLALALYASAHWGSLVAAGVERLAAGLVICAMAVVAANSLTLPFLHRVPRSFFPQETTDTEEAAVLVLRTARPNPRVIYIAPPLDCSLEDMLSYLSPETKVVRGDPPKGEHAVGNYVLSFLNKDPASRFLDLTARHLNPRPFLRLDPE
jgi:hypothetical protein